MQAHPYKLGANTLTILRDDQHQLHLSAASTWEIALKFRAGQLTLPHPPDEYIPDSLAIEPSHTLAVASIDGRDRDLIDRLLIGQAMVEDMTLITADPKLACSSVTTIDAAK